MEIEIALPQKFSQSGKSLRRLIQNNDMPTLDLLVRESVQNSLDAWNRFDKNVQVSFNVGRFESFRLAFELSGITDALNKKFGDGYYEYISIGDKHTTGLTGDITDPNGDEGNLQKLVYQICKAQEGEGAGGSWGIGKTVYFTVGIGLVIYYSRIKLENGCYESRLAASLVEDESAKDSLIPQYKTFKKRGVAWWGRKVDENATIAITDVDEIEGVLDIFGLDLYTGNDTGTRIIIPYINQKQLLAHNIVEYVDSLGVKTFLPWTNDVKAYLKMAVQKWYAPRLNNVSYKYGAYLKASVNQEGVGNIDETFDNTEPLFKIIQALYNRASGVTPRYGDILSNAELGIEQIVIKNSLLNTHSGSVAYIKADKKLLQMIPPYNGFEPLMYLNKDTEMIMTDVNKPIVCYTRRPGMIVSYDCVSEWTDGIPGCDKDHYIIGLFVLNSENKLKSEISNITLEEYVRKSELADHTSWSDITIKNNNPRIVSRIKKNVAQKISNAYKETIAEEQTNVNSGYSKFFGDMLLPPENFGKRPNGPRRGGGQPGTSINHKDVVLTIFTNKTQYDATGMTLSFEIKAKKAYSGLDMECLILMTESGNGSTFESWQGLLGLEVPFYVDKVDLSMKKWNNEKTVSAFCHLSNNTKKALFKGFSCEFMSTDDGICKGFTLTSEGMHMASFTGTIHLCVNRYDIKTTLSVDTKRGGR